MKYYLLLIVCALLSCNNATHNYEKPLLNEKDSIRNVEKKDSIVNFAGEWISRKKGGRDDFSIDIKRNKNLFKGTYCAVADEGQKTDCPDDKEQESSFTFEASNNNSVITDFTTNFSFTVGKVRLVLVNDTLFWEIIENPKGEYYCPPKAQLIR